MKRRRHTPEQIVRKLREADRLLGEGQELPEVAKFLEVSEGDVSPLEVAVLKEVAEGRMSLLCLAFLAVCAIGADVRDCGGCDCVRFRR